MPLLKIVAFLFVFLYLMPFMTALCCMFPTFRHVCFACLLYFTSNELSMSFLPIPDWPGTARGYTVSAVYLFAASLLLSMMFSFKYKVKLFPPGAFTYFLYYLAILLSGINAVHMRQWGFEVFKMFWMYITFLAVFNYLNNSRNLFFFAYVVCCILIVLFIVGFYQKYRMGIFQIRSTFPHQNSLSLYLELFGLLTLGILMNEQMSRLLFFLCLCAFGSSVLLIIFTYSRGGLVVYFGGIAIVCALSILFNGFSTRRLTLMLVGLLVMLTIVGYALPRIVARFTRAPESSKNTRIVLALASKRMANDTRLGFGANNYSEYSGGEYNYVQDYYAENDSPRYGGIVETIYLLVAAECGWWGLGTLILWFLYYYLSDIISMFVLRKMPCSGLAIGIFAGLTCNYWHSTLEWSLKQYNNFEGQMIIYALVGVIAVNRKNIKAAYQRKQEWIERQRREREKAELERKKRILATLETENVR
ncbi:MAG: O-antigen ligase family protein [Lentisphaeria bacterium]|nr:O-antigen ligase family protein [Lentisphaeria bacterium]